VGYVVNFYLVIYSFHTSIYYSYFILWDELKFNLNIEKYIANYKRQNA